MQILMRRAWAEPERLHFSGAGGAAARRGPRSRDPRPWPRANQPSGLVINRRGPPRSGIAGPACSAQGCDFNSATWLWEVGRSGRRSSRHVAAQAGEAAAAGPRGAGACAPGGGGGGARGGRGVG